MSPTSLRCLGRAPGRRPAEHLVLKLERFQSSGCHLKGEDSKSPPLVWILHLSLEPGEGPRGFPDLGK